MCCFMSVCVSECVCKCVFSVSASMMAGQAGAIPWSSGAKRRDVEKGLHEVSCLVCVCVLCVYLCTCGCVCVCVTVYH